MISIRIREARSADAASVSALMDELGYDLSPADVEARIEVYLRSSDAVLVADDCGEIVGFVSFHIIPLFHASSSLGRITAMCISSNRQREGIGRALLASLDEIASSCGCVRIEVTSGDQRAEDAHQFYQACGYAVDSRRFQKILNQGEEADG
jgi:GNAT superfamily N-acetyltransferase